MSVMFYYPFFTVLRVEQLLCKFIYLQISKEDIVGVRVIDYTNLFMEQLFQRFASPAFPRINDDNGWMFFSVGF